LPDEDNLQFWLQSFSQLIPYLPATHP
jgi:hypothetical protein